MRVPVSRRLLCAASLADPGTRAADVGTDHGYLPIHLILSGLCPQVTAADLREKPLATAQANAARFGVSDRITFVQSDGLDRIPPDSFDTLFCAGMGGDLITGILDRAPWLRDPKYTLILQPQSGGADLRRTLGEQGFSLERERLVRDGGFLYGVLRARYGGGTVPSPGEQYVSLALQRENDHLYRDYLARLDRSLTATIRGIAQSADPADQEKLEYYQTALAYIQSL